MKNPRDPEEMVAHRRVADAASLASPFVHLWETNLVIPICVAAPRRA